MTVRILVDADACPVKEEIYRVGARRKVKQAAGHPHDHAGKLLVLSRR